MTDIKNSQKVGLVLEGGANRGIFTSGVLDCLKKNEIYLPYVISVSVGTCNAIDYISRQIGRTKDCMIPHGRNTPPICWKNILKKKSPINLDMVFDEYPNKLIPFDYTTFWNSDIVTNCLTGSAEYFSPPQNRDKKRLMQICRASCSMPYILPEVYIDNIPYLDGGCSDPIPFKRAIKMGYQKNIVIMTRTLEYIPKKKATWLKKIERVMYSKYPNFVKLLSQADEQYQKILEEIKVFENQKKLLVIRPTQELAKRMEQNQNHMEAFYKHGYDVTNYRLNEIRDFIQ